MTQFNENIMPITQEIVEKLICSGQQVSGNFYTDPFVEINYLPNWNSNVPIIIPVSEQYHTCPKIILECPIEYHEATGRKDTPYYRMTLKDTDGNHIKTVVKTAQDIKKDPISNQFVDELELDIPFEKLDVGIATTFKIDLEVKLEERTWGSFFSKPSLKKTHHVITESPITVIVELPENIVLPTGIQETELSLKCIPALASPNNPPQIYESSCEIGWNTAYTIALDAVISPEIISSPGNGELSNARLLNKVKEEMVYLEAQDSAVIKKTGWLDEFEIEQNFALASNAEPIYWSQIFADKGNWQWHIDEEISQYTAPLPTGPVKKIYTWIATIDDGDSYIYQTKELIITVIVPQEKLAAAWSSVGYYAGSLLVGIGGTLLCAALGVALSGYGAPVAVVLGIAGIVCTFIGIHLDQESTKQESIANACSRELDFNYSEIIDHINLINEAEKHFVLPLGDEADIEVPSFIENYYISRKKVTALTEAISVTETRYLNARREENEDIATKQRQACEQMLHLLEEEMIKIVDGFEQVYKYFDENPIQIDDNILNETVQNIKDSGISEDLRNTFLEQGMSSKTLEKIEEKLTQIDPADIKSTVDLEELSQSLPEKVKDIQERSISAYFRALAFAKNIRNIEKLEGSDLLNSLYNYGLLTYSEFMERIQGIGFSHTIDKIQFISEDAIAKLVDLEIKTTYQFLLACATPTHRRNLNKKLKNGDYDIIKWANIADLLRIERMDEFNAVILEKVGVDTVKELATRNPQNLYGTVDQYVSDHIETGEINIDYKRPSRSDVFHWISAAKRLQPILKY